MQWLRKLLGIPPKDKPATSPPPASAPVSKGPNSALPDLSDMIAAANALNLRKEHAYPLLYLDRSGSTNEYPNRLWDDGTMQLLTSLVAAVTLGGFSATPEQAAPLRFFHYGVRRPLWPDDGLIRSSNVHQILGRNRALDFGGTYFIPPLMDMVRQALLIHARENTADHNSRVDAIKAMTDDDLLRFIKPKLVNGKEQLQPLLKLRHPILAFLGTDGMCSESLERLLEVVRWMSQLGIYIMLIGVGHHDFAVLKGMDEAGEELFLKKGLRPLWDNVDFVDLKELTGGDANRLPDGPTVVNMLVGKFMNKAYGSCRSLHLIA